MGVSDKFSLEPIQWLNDQYHSQSSEMRWPCGMLMSSLGESWLLLWGGNTPKRLKNNDKINISNMSNSINMFLIEMMPPLLNHWYLMIPRFWNHRQMFFSAHCRAKSPCCVRHRIWRRLTNTSGSRDLKGKATEGIVRTGGSKNHSYICVFRSDKYFIIFLYYLLM